MKMKINSVMLETIANRESQYPTDNKKEFLSSFHLTKEKIPGTNIEIDIINML